MLSQMPPPPLTIRIPLKSSSKVPIFHLPSQRSSTAPPFGISTYSHRVMAPRVTTGSAGAPAQPRERLSLDDVPLGEQRDHIPSRRVLESAHPIAAPGEHGIDYVMARSNNDANGILQLHPRPFTPASSADHSSYQSPLGSSVSAIAFANVFGGPQILDESPPGEMGQFEDAEVISSSALAGRDDGRVSAAGELWRDSVVSIKGWKKEKFAPARAEKLDDRRSSDGLGDEKGGLRRLRLSASTVSTSSFADLPDLEKQPVAPIRKNKKTRFIFPSLITLVLLLTIANLILLDLKIFHPFPTISPSQRDSSICLSLFTLTAPSAPLSFPCAPCTSSILSHTTPSLAEKTVLQFCALQSIYHSLPSSNSSLDSGWMKSTNVCAYGGVVCDSQGRVSRVTLDLGGRPGLMDGILGEEVKTLEGDGVEVVIAY
jgi:hypothetical protein